MAYINLRISGKNGKMYESSREPREGFDKVVYGDNGDKVTYHKYYQNIKGDFVGFSLSEMRNDNSSVMMLNVKMKDDNDIYTISTPLKTSYGSISKESKALISAFYGAKANHNYTVTSFIKSNEGSDGKKYDNLNVYVNSTSELNEEGKGVSTGFIPFSDIPKPEKDDDGMGGITYNNKAVNMFFASKIREIESRFNSSNTVSEPKNTEESKSTEKNKSKSKVDTPVVSVSIDTSEDDDLPF